MTTCFLVQTTTHNAHPCLAPARNVGFISMMLPNATIIHADRHPADTVFSCYAQPFERRGITWSNNLTGGFSQGRG